MLVGVAFLHPTLWNIGILHYKQAKLRKHLQHSVFKLHDATLFIFYIELEYQGQ